MEQRSPPQVPPPRESTTTAFSLSKPVAGSKRGGDDASRFDPIASQGSGSGAGAGGGGKKGGVDEDPRATVCQAFQIWHKFGWKDLSENRTRVDLTTRFVHWLRAQNLVVSRRQVDEWIGEMVELYPSGFGEWYRMCPSGEFVENGTAIHNQQSMTSFMHPVKEPTALSCETVSKSAMTAQQSLASGSRKPQNTTSLSTTPHLKRPAPPQTTATKSAKRKLLPPVVVSPTPKLPSGTDSLTLLATAASACQMDSMATPIGCPNHPPSTHTTPQAAQEGLLESATPTGSHHHGANPHKIQNQKHPSTTTDQPHHLPLPSPTIQAATTLEPTQSTPPPAPRVAPTTTTTTPPSPKPKTITFAQLQTYSQYTRDTLIERRRLENSHPLTTQRRYTPASMDRLRYLQTGWQMPVGVGYFAGGESAEREVEEMVKVVAGYCLALEKDMRGEGDGEEEGVGGDLVSMLVDFETEVLGR
ncbi:hypothetical protein HDU98_001912 [Podochytrium sp. JEL0797]|nr:hypothetical protein HDU98_001912 [Podochytrium sp. JEL0797]